MQATMDKLNFTIKVSQFFLDLVREAEEYKEGYDEGTLSLYMNIILELFVESRGGECFDTLGDTGAREQFSCLLEELLPRHTTDFQVQQKFLSDLIPLLSENYEAIKGVSPEAIVYAFVKMCCVGGDISNHIVPEAVIVAEIAEEYKTTAEKMTPIINDFRILHSKFNVYKWRNYELIEEFEEYILASLVSAQ